jgi:hypothetical protein
VQYNTLVDGNIDFVFLLDQLLDAFLFPAMGQRLALIAQVRATRHQCAEILVLNTPAGLFFLFDVTHYLACLLKTIAGASAAIATRYCARFIRSAGRPDHQTDYCKQGEISD